MIDMTVCEAVERATDAYEAATTDDERVRIARARVCPHPTVCGDSACRSAGHEHEMVGGMDDGWACGNDDCQCVATCGLPLARDPVPSQPASEAPAATDPHGDESFASAKKSDPVPAPEPGTDQQT